MAIVLHTPLLSFPRRQAGGSWGGMGYPEIKSFYELPDLAERGTQPAGRDDGSSPLPGSFCESGTPPATDRRARHPLERLELRCPRTETQPQETSTSMRRTLCSPVCGQAQHFCKPMLRKPALAFTSGGVQTFLRFFWKFLLTPFIRKGRKSKKNIYIFCLNSKCTGETWR